MKDKTARAITTIIIGATAYFLICQLAKWQVAVGIFLAAWANNVDRDGRNPKSEGEEAA